MKNYHFKLLATLLAGVLLIAVFFAVSFLSIHGIANHYRDECMDYSRFASSEVKYSEFVCFEKINEKWEIVDL